MAPLALVLAVSGCGVTIEHPGSGESEWMSKSEFRDYAEAVLRRQNAVTSELIFLMPVLAQSDPAAHRRLADLEDQMMEACQALIAHAMDRRRGARTGFPASLRLPGETAACDRQTARLEQLLEEQALP